MCSVTMVTHSIVDSDTYLKSAFSLVLLFFVLNNSTKEKALLCFRGDTFICIVGSDV